MSASNRVQSPLRILFFGLPAGVSALILRKLLSEGFILAGMVVPAASVPHLVGKEKRSIYSLMPHGIRSVINGGFEDANTLDVAWTAGMPVWAVENFNHSDLHSIFDILQIDVACVACFTRRIPPALLALPKLGFINFHPSLLPQYRGPVPRFWQLRDGATIGVTVHYLDEGLDTGDIITQTGIQLPDGISGLEADRILAFSGSVLLSEVLQKLASGTVAGMPQPAGGTYFGFPAAGDFEISTDWPARRAFNFIRGTADWHKPYLVRVANTSFLIESVEGWDGNRHLSAPYEQLNGRLAINFTPGVLYARIAGQVFQG